MSAVLPQLEITPQRPDWLAGATTRQRQDRQTATYRALIDIAEVVMARTKTEFEKTANMRGKDLFAAMRIDAIRDDIAHYCGLGERVIDQARRRVLDGEQVPNAEKIYSIFEPHTDLIKRGKVRTPVEFGHKVFLAESAKGLITQYEVLKGNPTDEVHVAPSLKRAPAVVRIGAGFEQKPSGRAIARPDSVGRPYREAIDAGTVEGRH